MKITSKIRAIVTDNPTTMQKMRDIIELRCFVHAINLIS
ncbi:unnamed protein product, partial [Rotaria magnacalcarata]